MPGSYLIEYQVQSTTQQKTDQDIIRIKESYNAQNKIEFIRMEKDCNPFPSCVMKP